jgi:hypothetical protein
MKTAVVSANSKNKPRNSKKIKKQEDMFQTKEQDNCPSEVKIRGLPDKEFKIMVRKVLTKVWRAMHQQTEFPKWKTFRSN